MVSPSIEEYLEALYRLKEKGEAITTTKISEALKLAPPSVTEMLRKLDEMGYVKYEPYKEAILTEKGIAEGKRILRRHRLWEKFLVDFLGIKKEKAHEEACKLEHAASAQTEGALCRMMRHPDKCPDDEEIPACDKDVENCSECSECVEHREENIIPLLQLPEGGCGVVKFLRGGRGLIQRLADMGMSPGTAIRMLKSAPFHGPVEICVKGCNIALGRGVASKIFVVPAKEGKK